MVFTQISNTVVFFFLTNIVPSSVFKRCLISDLKMVQHLPLSYLQKYFYAYVLQHNCFEEKMTTNKRNFGNFITL